MSESTPRSGILQDLRELRDRMVPMLRELARQFRGRVAPGYPVIVDDVESGGYFGLALAPEYGLYVLAEGERLVVQLQTVFWRTDVHSSAGRERFGATPRVSTLPISTTMSDAQIRDLLARVLANWHKQPLLIHQSDS
uniref:YdhG-like domain-containing protein n=1 Tax=Thermorudis peleae TaxID=1382356 RepID=A0A831WZM6_9BACT